MAHVYASSSLLFPDKVKSNYKQWGFMANTPVHAKEIPNCVTAERCKKCSSFLFPEEICPICYPNLAFELENYNSVKDFSIIQRDVPKFPQIILITFDLSIPSVVLHQLIYSLISDDFLNKCPNTLFRIAFIGMNPILISRKDGHIHLSFNYTYFPGSEVDFTPKELPQLLEEILVLISTSGIPSSCSEPVLVKFFSAISKEKISHAIFFHNSDIHNINKPPFKMHFITVTTNGKITPLNIQSSYLNGWSHCAVSQTTNKLLEYLIQLIDPNVPHECTQTIILSMGLELAWVCTHLSTSTPGSSKASIHITDYDKAQIVSYAVRPTSKYSKQNFFSVQLVSMLSDGSTYVTSRVWRKADTLEEFLQSIDPLVLAGLVFKHSAATYLDDAVGLRGRPLQLFSRSFKWNVQGLGDESNQFSVSIAVRRFNSVVAALPLEMAAMLMLFVNSRGRMYLNELFASLCGPNGRGSFVVPPFVLFAPDTPPPPAEKLHAFDCGLAPIAVQIDGSTFAALSLVLTCGDATAKDGEE